MDTIEIKDVRNESEMLVRQDHERRLTILEIHMGSISTKMDNVETVVKQGNDEQKEMLTTIQNRMFDEFFKRKETNLTNSWKLILGIMGGGSFLFLVVERILQSLG